MDLDRELFVLVNRAWSCQTLDYLAALVAAKQLWLVPGTVILAAAVLRGGRRARTGLLLAALTFCVGDWAVVAPVKALVGRPRPNEALSGVRRVAFRKDLEPRIVAALEAPRIWLEGPKTGKRPRSFPSGHSFNAFAVATVLALWLRPWGWALYGVAGLIAFLRVYAGLHWPSDVVPSAVLGTLFGLAALALYERLRRHLPPRWAERFPSRRPGVHP
jgi:membrane-associated phospholipid phosphatase